MENKDLFLILVLCAAIFTRVPYVFQESVWNDETVYMWLGGQIFHNPLFLFSQTVAYHSYGYLLDISTAVLSIFTSGFYASRIATFLVALLGVALVYKLTSEVTNEWGGLAAGFILAFNSQHSFFSVRSLTDVWLATTLTLFTYAASRYKGKKEDGILMGIATILAMMSRVSGVLVIGLAGLFALREIVKKNFNKGLTYFIGIMGGLFVILMAANFIFFGSPMQFGGASLKGGIFTGSRSYYISAAPAIYSLPVFLLAIIGMYFALKDERMHFVAGGFLIYFFWFSILAGEKVPRYVLQTVPLAAVLSVFGLYKIVEGLELDKRLVGLGIILALLTYPLVGPLLSQRALTYTGFQDLGKSIKNLDAQHHFSQVYAQSARQIREFSSIEYVGDGGRLQSLPQNVSDLLGESNILVELDLWEYTGPSWAYPLDQNKLNALLALNFTIVNVVQKDILTQSGPQKSPVGFILVK